MSAAAETARAPKRPASIFTNAVERAFSDSTKRSRPTPEEIELLGLPAVDQGNLPNPVPANQAPAPSARAVQARSAAAMARVMGWYSQNPNSFLQQVQPKTSTASAHGLFFVQDAALWNLLDEIVARSLTIKGAADLIFSLIDDREETFEAVDPNDDEAAEVAKLAAQDLMLDGAMNGWLALKQTLTIRALMAGYSVAEASWAINADGRLAPKSYKHRHPGLFAFDNDGGLYTMGTGAGTFAPAEFGKFAFASTPGLYASPYGDSAAFAMRYDWFFGREAARFWIRFADKYGFPLLTGKINDADLNAEKNAQVDTRMADLEDALKNLPEAGALVIPPGTLIDVLDRTGGMGGADTPHAAIMNFYEGRLVRFLLATDMLTQAPGKGEGGGYALGKVHEGMMQTRIKPTAKMGAAAINRGVLAPWLLWNFGPQMAGRVRYAIDLDDEADIASIKEVISVARDTGLTVSKSQLREWTGLNAPKPDDPDDALTLSTSDVFQYHLTYGIVTINQALARLGFPPIEGGDVPVDPARIAAVNAMTTGVGDNAAVFSDDPNKPKPSPDSPAPTTFADPTKPAAIPAVLRRGDRARQLRYLARLDAIAGAMREASREELATALTLNAEQIRKLAEADDSLLGSIKAPALEPLGIDAIIMRGFASARALALQNAISTARTFAPGVGKIPDGAVVHPLYADALEWMTSRKLASVDEVAKLRDAILSLDGNPGDAAKIEAAIRDGAQALTGATNETLGRVYQEHLAAAVNEGKTVQEFTAGIEEAILNAGEPLPGEAYLENVYRTETAGAYQKQREEAWSDDGIDPYVGGFEFFNPGDARSRPSHAALDGLIIRKGSDAHAALPDGPPFSFQCRCQMVPIMIPDPSNNDVDESPDALARVTAIETFDS